MVPDSLEVRDSRLPANNGRKVASELATIPVPSSTREAMVNDSTLSAYGKQGKRNKYMENLTGEVHEIEKIHNIIEPNKTRNTATTEVKNLVPFKRFVNKPTLSPGQGFQ
jgi:hypothetical protein